ncbi:MAG: hypothetical protein DRI86_11125 [Bacteroidetes bacterium]|nr:MAG: hypothetical protein DRI86_11125 [Bacteroidota bacterium]
MSLQSLKDRLFGGSQEDKIIESLYVVMKEFGYTLEELKKLPIPTLKIILKLLEKEYKAMNKKIPKKW